MERFHMTAEQNGMMLSYIGAISIFMQGIGIGFVTKFFSDSSLMTGCTVLLTIVYYLLVS